ncbi:MAG: DUF4294 domain-containing protein, partial [Flavobacterium sp.]|nr:DUF4294 domain-containing protein [Flavobacterium sp.]MBP6099932.1 DUF4294 domain-containing protein [Flavobacterium sp.]
MKKRVLFIVVFLTSFALHSQIIPENLDEINFIENDTLLNDTIALHEVLIYNVKLDPEEQKQFLLLQNRVYKVYPYAKTASDRLTAMNKNLEKLKSNKDRKKYFRIIEDYMENEFKAKLKKLSRKQGQILVKLIHRQTGITTFDLIKDYKSGWKAFWSNNTARLFDINLKKKYEPFDDNEDYLIETILDRAFT